MTWMININGSDDLSGDEKIAYEDEVVDAARNLAQSLKGKEGGKVTTATCYTNTTNQVNLITESVEG